jgi:hypothetical protein
MADGFKIVRNYHLEQICSVLEVNIKMFLDNALLRIGAWGTVLRNQESMLGDSLSKLYPDKNAEGLVDYTVWRSQKRQWVWENDIVYYRNGVPLSPIPAKVFVNSVVDNSAKIDYRNGTVSFDFPLFEHSSVEAEFSYREVDTYTSEEGYGRPYITFDSTDMFRREHYDQAFYDVQQENGVQLPYVNIETFPQGNARPYALGTGALRVLRRIQFNVAARTPNERNKIIDCVNLQSHKTIPLFDINKVIDEGVFPLLYDGSVNPNGLPYKELIKWGGAYRMTNIQVGNVNVRQIRSPRSDLYLGSVHFTSEVILAKAF